MRVALADIGRHGRMELTFALQDGKTILENSYCEVPFKVTRVLSTHSPMAHIILMHSTAGLFGGDDLECVIRVKSGARVRLTQQAATKIHPSENQAAVQRMRVQVEAGAELQLFMEPVIPFAESRLRQQTHLDVAENATLSYWEGFMTGRLGRAESWQFRELASETRLTIGGRLSYLDRFQLEGGTPHRSTMTMGSAGYTGLGLHVGKDARRIASELHGALPDAGVDNLEETISIVRVVSPDGPHFHHSREIFCRHAGGDGKIQP
jgi:urease accessory protein